MCQDFTKEIRKYLEMNENKNIHTKLMGKHSEIGATGEIYNYNRLHWKEDR